MISETNEIAIDQLHQAEAFSPWVSWLLVVGVVVMVLMNWKEVWRRWRGGGPHALG